MAKSGSRRGPKGKTLVSKVSDRSTPDSEAFDPHSTKPVAVVDIGSNSVRLVVYEALNRSPTPIYNEKVVCGLGRLLPTRGKMGRANIERALNALKRFRAIVDALDAGPMRVIATAAAREATDGQVFVKAAEAICDAPVAVLTGEQEAELAAAGVTASVENPSGLAGDLGGGSLELINIDGGTFKDRATMPLGGLRLIEAGGTNFGKIQKIIDRQLETLDWLDQGTDRPFYAVGGTWRAIARLHMGFREYPLHVLHQYRISPGEAIRFARYLQERPVDFLGDAGNISRPRIETVPYGAAVMQRLIKRIKPSEIVTCATGIREGLLYNLLPRKMRKEDGFLSTCHLLSELRSRSPENARELQAWTDKLFTSLNANETKDEKRLRHAACLVADLGWRAHPDYRSAQSVAVLENAASTSIDHQGLAFLSLVIYFRHEGFVRDEFSDRFRTLTSRSTQRRARILGVALRAAHMVGIATPGILPKTPVRVVGDKLVLTLPKKFASLDGERLRRRFKLLARELGKSFEIKS